VKKGFKKGYLQGGGTDKKSERQILREKLRWVVNGGGSLEKDVAKIRGEKNVGVGGA